MLKYPDDSEPYLPRISYFLGGIEIYDREETLGEELWAYDPNDKGNRNEVIRKYILPIFECGENYRHRYILFKALENALQNQAFDFASLF